MVTSARQGCRQPMGAECCVACWCDACGNEPHFFHLHGKERRQRHSGAARIAAIAGDRAEQQYHTRKPSFGVAASFYRWCA